MSREDQAKDQLRAITQGIQGSLQGLSACGRAVKTLLDRILLELSTDEQPAMETADRLAKSLLDLSSEKINSFPYSRVPPCWRRLYTDSTLLSSVSLLRQVDLYEATLLDVVRALDMSLIVAGAPGQDRPEYVFALIELAQSRLPSRSPQRPCKRRRIASPPPPLAPPYLDTPVRQLPDLPDFLLPLSEPTHAEPFVVRSAATDWEAAARWKDLEYLQKVGGGRGRVVPVEVGQDYTKAGWGQEIVAWDAFLRETFSHTAQEERHDYYLAQHSLLTQFPRLSADFPIPSLVYSQPAPLEDQYPDYEPPKSQDGWVMNAWLGKGGTVSQAHTDPYWNCYVQVVGSKWVWIAPPCVSVHMSAFGSSSQPLGDLAEDGQDCTTATEYMTNTSTIDVTLPIPKTSPSFTTFETHVRPHAQQVVLGPGDLLVMPPGWWHAMKSLETSFSISTWF